MRNRAVAKRYATALIELALQQSAVDQTQHDLELVVNTIETNDELCNVFYGQVEPQVKQQLVKELFEGKVSALVLKFLQFVISKRREDELRTMAEVFGELANEWRNLIDVEVTTGTELPEDELAPLERRLRELTGKEVALKVNVDPALLGGLRVKIGDLVIDGSVAARLRMMATQLQSASSTSKGMR